jgi:hypothetical protein
MHNLIKRNFYIYILILVIGLILFYPIHEITINQFHNDDIRLIKDISGAYNNYLSFIFTPYFEKFRPVANVIYILEFLSFRNSWNLYIGFNIILLSLLGVALAHVFYNINNRKYFSLALAIIITFSKFFYYSIYNITGSYEIAALIFFILSINSLIFTKSLSKCYLYCFLAIFTNERYLPLMFMPLFYEFIQSNYVLFKLKYLKLLIFPISILGFIVILKKYILHIAFFVGTGGTLVTNTISVNSLAKFYLQSLLEMLGGSFGPAYLTGADIISDFFDIWSIAVLLPFVIILFCIFYITLVNFNKLKNKYLNNNCILFGLYILLFSITSSVTFRLELRWIAASFILWFLLINYIKNDRVFYIIMASYLILDILFFIKFGNLFYFNTFSMYRLF